MPVSWKELSDMLNELPFPPCSLTQIYALSHPVLPFPLHSITHIL